MKTLTNSAKLNETLPPFNLIQFNSQTLTDTAELNETAVYFATIDQNSDVLTVILKVFKIDVLMKLCTLFSGWCDDVLNG